MVPKYLTEQERAERVHTLVAMEIARIVDDLEVREMFLLDMWGRHRDRGPFLDTIASRWTSLGFRELSLLDVDTVLKVEEFYRELDEFRLYMRFTEDMPASLASSFRWQLVRLRGYGEQAVDALGGVPERPVLEFPDEEENEPDAGGRPLLELAHFEKPEGEDS